MSGDSSAPEAVAAREPQQYKIEAVASLRRMLERTPNAVFADYTGLDVGAMADLRRALIERDSTLRVVKNRFLRIALDSLRMPASEACLTGPTAVATLGSDPSDACKVLVDVRRDPPLKIKGAMVYGQLLDPEQVKDLAEMPSLGQLYAMLLSAMNEPVRSVAGVLQGVIRKLIGTLQAVADQPGAGQPAGDDQGGAANEADG